MHATFQRMALGLGVIFAHPIISASGGEAVSAVISHDNSEVLVSTSTEADVAYELHRSYDLVGWQKIAPPVRGDATDHVLHRSEIDQASFFQIRTYTIYAPETLPAYLPDIISDEIGAEGGTSEFTWIDDHSLQWIITMDDSEQDARVVMRSTLSYFVSGEDLNKTEMRWEIGTYQISFLSSGQVLFGGTPEEFAAMVGPPAPSHAISEMDFTGRDSGAHVGKLYFTDGSSVVISETFEAL